MSASSFYSHYKRFYDTTSRSGGISPKVDDFPHLSHSYGIFFPFRDQICSLGHIDCYFIKVAKFFEY